MTKENPLETISVLFASEGAADYLGELVTQAQHMLQAAYWAAEASLPEPLIGAALLHDVGHFQGSLTGADLMKGTDNHHGEAGARWLEQWFGEALTEPVRLHVEAKRYLCTAEPDYFDRLSPASVYTLGVQGGPMTSREASAFSHLAFAEDAILVRRCDEKAKTPDLAVPPLDAYHVVLEHLL